MTRQLDDPHSELERLRTELVAARKLARSRLKRWRQARERSTFLLNLNHRHVDEIRALKASVRALLTS